jgi:hypothetical protein
MTRFESIPRGRAAVAAGLAVVAAVLFLMEQPAPLTPADRAASLRGDLRSVNATVDTVLARYGIAQEQVRSWQVQTRDRKFLRTERRVMVPPDFISVKFNHDLNEALDGTGARVVATERTKENTVTSHIKRGSTIMESITFVMNRKQTGTSAATGRRAPGKRR